MVAASGTPGTGGANWVSSLVPRVAPCVAEAAVAAGSLGGRVVMVLAYFDIFEHAERILGVNRQRAVERDEVGGNRAPVDAHEAHREARRDLARHARLEQADDALFLLARAQEQDLGIAVARERHLVGRNEG